MYDKLALRLSSLYCTWSPVIPEDVIWERWYLCRGVQKWCRLSRRGRGNPTAAEFCQQHAPRPHGRNAFPWPWRNASYAPGAHDGQHGAHGQHGAYGAHGQYGAYGTHGQYGQLGPHGAYGQHGQHGPHGKHGVSLVWIVSMVLLILW